MKRRDVIAGVGAVGLAALPVGGNATPTFPMVERSPAGRRGRPFGAHPDLARYDYIEDEYIISGKASRYRPVGELRSDGRWTVEPWDAGTYRTRILVRRPRDKHRFNGAVIVEWLNVTAGCELSLLEDGLFEQGFAHVGVSAQRVGVHGNAVNPQGLIHWDAERYAGLSIPGDSLCYDIFTQAACAVGPNRQPGATDPMGGLPVRRLIATGGSQSGSRLTTYYNAIQPLALVFDGIVPLITNGFAPGFDDRTMDMSVTPLAEILEMIRFKAAFRDDLATPLIMVNSESEVFDYRHVAQSDNKRFRRWEVAGASHLPGPAERRRDELFRRDGIIGNPLGARGAPSEVSWAPTATAAFVAMQRWVETGRPAPQFPPIAVVSGEGPAVVRDEFGNAMGGVRLPELEVPVAHYTGTMPSGTSSLSGETVVFPVDTVKRLYPDHQTYVRKVARAAARAERKGAILPARKAEYVAAARGFGAGRIWPMMD